MMAPWASCPACQGLRLPLGALLCSEGRGRVCPIPPSLQSERAPLAVWRQALLDTCHAGPGVRRLRMPTLQAGTLKWVTGQ